MFADAEMGDLAFRLPAFGPAELAVETPGVQVQRALDGLNLHKPLKLVKPGAKKKDFIIIAVATYIAGDPGVLTAGLIANALRQRPGPAYAQRAPHFSRQRAHRPAVHQ